MLFCVVMSNCTAFWRCYSLCVVCFRVAFARFCFALAFAYFASLFVVVFVVVVCVLVLSLFLIHAFMILLLLRGCGEW